MHFLVMVIGDEPEEQLEPFRENNFGTCSEEYLEFNDVEDESREHYLTGIFDYPGAKANAPGLFGKPLREVFPTFEDYMEVYGPEVLWTGP
jgi:hypothetical protein